MAVLNESVPPNIKLLYTILLDQVKRRMVEGVGTDAIVHYLLDRGVNGDVAKLLVGNAASSLGITPQNAWWTTTATYLISHPKSGVTWLKVCLGKLFQLESAGFCDKTFVKQRPYFDVALPNVIFSFAGADADHEKITDTLDADRFRHKKKILLIRDPRDVVVSYYFQMSKRLNRQGIPAYYSGTIHDFIRDERFGIKRIIHFMNFLSESVFDAETDIMIKYEDMHAGMHHEIDRICRFHRFFPSKHHVDLAIEFSMLKNMRKMEWEGYYDHAEMAPGNREDKESFKVREGVVGGYMNHLSDDDRRFVAHAVNRHLSSFYGFYRD